MKKLRMLIPILLLLGCNSTRFYFQEPDYERMGSFKKDMEELKVIRNTYKDSLKIIRAKETHRVRINDSDKINYTNWVYFNKKNN